MTPDMIRQTADIAAAFVAHNTIRPGEVPDLISSIHTALADLGRPKQPEADKAKPAVDLPWKKTIKYDHLISLVDGKSYKTLRRHLLVKGLTPDEYRQRYDLPRDYPMVAPAYSEARSALAKAAGLGNQRRAKAEAPERPPEEPAPAKAALSKPARGRPKKAAAAA